MARQLTDANPVSCRATATRRISFDRPAGGRSLRRLIAAAALGAFGLGCALPQTNLDYCSPTVDANGNPVGNFMYRRGSVLGGVPGVPVYAGNPQPTPATPPDGNWRPATGTPTEAAPPDGMPTRAASADGPTPTRAVSATQSADKAVQQALHEEAAE